MSGTLKIGLGIVLGLGLAVALCCGGGGFLASKSPPPPGQEKTQEVGSTVIRFTSTPVPVGRSRENPAPFGYPLDNGDRLECTVLGVERGISLGWETPGEGNEFIAVTLRLRNSGPPDQTKRYAPSDFRVVGSKGSIYNPMFLFSEVEGGLGSGEFFGGSEVTGKIVQEAGIGEMGLVLIWDAGLGVDARYLSLEE